LQTRFYALSIVCLDIAKNSIRMEKLKIINEDSEKVIIFKLS
jgi:hypothetical protein